MPKAQVLFLIPEHTYIHSYYWDLDFVLRVCNKDTHDPQCQRPNGYSVLRHVCGDS